MEENNSDDWDWGCRCQILCWSRWSGAPVRLAKPYACVRRDQCMYEGYYGTMRLGMWLRQKYETRAEFNKRIDILSFISITDAKIGIPLNQPRKAYLFNRSAFLLLLTLNPPLSSFRLFFYRWSPSTMLRRMPFSRTANTTSHRVHVHVISYTGNKFGRDHDHDTVC